MIAIFNNRLVLVEHYLGKIKYLKYFICNIKESYLSLIFIILKICILINEGLVITIMNSNYITIILKVRSSYTKRREGLKTINGVNSITKY